MRTDAWYNWHFWWWDLRSWLCHWKWLECNDCRRNRLFEEDRELDPNGWCKKCVRVGYCDLDPDCGRIGLKDD